MMRRPPETSPEATAGDAVETAVRASDPISGESDAAVAAVAAQARLVAGTTFGNYRIVRLLGEGGMGIVYEALHLELRKRVAIKIMRRDLARDEMARIRFVREGEAAARVRHPHVVDVSDVGNHGGMPFLVMELLDGEELEVRLRRDGRFDLESALDVLFPVIAAVAAGHDQGVIHRDLKPQNIFLSRQANGQMIPKVLDFGVSKLLDPHGGAAVNLTVAGAIYGTVQYMAPEQADGSGRVDPRSDQYALAAILAECLTGQRAFPGDNLLELLRRICAGDFPRPRTLRADLPPELEDAILRAMSLAPDARFPSLYALGHALLPFASLRARVLWEGTFTTPAAPTRAEATEGVARPSPQSGQTLPLPPTPGGGTAVLQQTQELSSEPPPGAQPPTGLLPPTALASPAPGPHHAVAAVTAPAPARGRAPAPVRAPARGRSPAPAQWRRLAPRIALATGALAIGVLALAVLWPTATPQTTTDPPGDPAPARPASSTKRALTIEPAPTMAAARAATTAPAPGAPPATAPLEPPPVAEPAVPQEPEPVPEPVPRPTRLDYPAPESTTAAAAPREPPPRASPTHKKARRPVQRTRNNAPVTD